MAATKTKGKTKTKAPGIRLSDSGKYFFRERVTMSDGSIKQIQRTYSTLAEALLQREVIRQKETVEPSTHEMTFEVLANMYYEFKRSEKVKATTIYGLKKIFSKHVIPYFGNKNISNITSNDILKWKDIMNNLGLSDNYKQKAYTNFKATFNYANIYLQIHNNPFLKVSNFKSTKMELEPFSFYTHDEFLRFDAAAYNKSLQYPYKLFFEFAYYTGCRKGEIKALNWNDINWTKKTVKITKSLMDIPELDLANELGRSISWKDKIGDPKNIPSFRELDISGFLYDQLKLFYEECKKSIEDFSDKCLIFGINEPLSDSSLDRWMLKFCVAAKLKKIKVHELRHSHASLLISLGFTVFEVSKRLGHGSIKETMETYGHLYPDVQKRMSESTTSDRLRILK